MTEEEKLAAKQQYDDANLRTILKTRHGRAWLWKHLGDCGLTLNPFTGQRDATDFNCGRQSVAQSLLTDINRVQPTAFALMINEAQLTEDYYDDRGSSSTGSGSNDDGTGSNSDYNDRGEYDPLGSVGR